MYSFIAFKFSILNMKVEFNKSSWLTLDNTLKHEKSVSVKYIQTN